jgi:hypothetical protein
MFANIRPVQRFRFVLAAALPLSCATNMVAAQSVPMLVQAESMTLLAPMTAGYDIAAMGGRFISVPSGTTPPKPTPAASVQVNVPAGTYYLWARIAGPTSTGDALYVGIDSSFDRVFPSAPGPYQWVQVETFDGSGAHGFSLDGNHIIQVGYGEIGAKLDAVYLTADASEVPSFSSPARLLIEAEVMTLEPASQMSVGGDDTSLSRQYLTTSAATTTNPVRRASVQVHVPAGNYYLWARVGGPSEASDALYVGIDSSFARVFPSPPAPYRWVKVATGLTSSSFEFALLAGTHFIQVGEGETNARLDAVYLTSNASEVPTFAPMRRVIEAESFIPLPTNPPMTVGTDADANGAQYVSVMSGTDSTNPVPEARTTVHVPPGGGTYYLWARLKGPSSTSDALYVGFDNTWNRVFPSSPGAYEWVRAESVPGQGFTLTAGAHDIQVGHGEIGARLDAVYVTDDANDSPPGSTGLPLGPCVNPSGGYEGFGRNTTGGAGKPIYRVTNLNNSGTGSLRDAVSVGNRCVVFDVGGTINLASQFSIRGANITIDGFTAPSPGITLRNTTTTDQACLSINGNNGAGNVVVRGIRVRLATDDGISVYNASNVVIDHVSVSGFGDGAVDVTQNSHDVTIQWSIFGAGNPAINFPTLIAFASTRVTVHHNLYISNDYRHPLCSYGSSAPSEAVCDVRNNLIWDYAGHGTSLQNFGAGNVVNNYYYSTGRQAHDGRTANESNTIYLASGGSAYVSGNYSRNGWNLEGRGNRSTPFSVIAPATTDAITAARAVREGAGARNLPTWGLDAADQGYINQIPENP